MQTYTVNHRLRKNLPNGTLYNSQVATLIFIVGVAFKLSSAPGIISSQFGSSTLWMFLLYTSLEAILLVAILSFSRMNGDGFLLAQNSASYRIVCALTSILLTLKATFYFCFFSAYITHELFSSTEPYLVYIVFLAPIIYLGAKGMRTVARSAEIFILIFFALITLNLIFLDTDLDFGRNLPVFAVPPSEFFANFPRFGLLIGDFLPFLFIRINDKRMPYITISASITWTLINVVVALGLAIYGNALKMISELLIHIAAFNQLTLEIGRMEWTNLFTMLIMSIFSLSFLFCGAIDSCNRAVKTAIPAKIIFPASLICASVFVPSANSVTYFSMSWFGYVLFATSVFIPLALLVILFASKQKYKGWYACLHAELKVKKRTSAIPNSLADGILDGFKDSAKANEQIMPNGTLQPKENKE